MEEKLLRAIKGCKVICVIKSVSRSGMCRKMQFYVLYDNQLIWLNPTIRDIANYKLDKDRNVIVNGCGMDMIFNTLYNFNCAMIQKDLVTDISHADRCRYYFDANNYYHI